MPNRRFTMLAAALVSGVSLTCGAVTASAAVRPNTFTGKATGYGATLAAAENAAELEIEGDYYGCKLPIFLIADGQEADGTWWADMAENGCQGYI